MEELKMTELRMIDDGEGGIQYNCKNTIIDINQLNKLIHELEALK